MNNAKLWMLVLLVLLFGCVRKQTEVFTSASSSPIYDEKADAHRDIAAAIANSEASERNVVLIFGANW
jgi:hypothetical protein